MDDKASANSPWSLSGTIGHLECGVIAGDLDVARPLMGLRQESFDHGRVPCMLFMTARSPELDTIGKGGDELEKKLWPLSLEEVYVRDNDLVAAYSPAAEWPYAPQLYWSASTLQSVDGILGSLSYLVSVHTHLLDTHPKIDVYSELPSSEYHYISLAADGSATIEPIDNETTKKPTSGTCGVLRRLVATPVSYIEIAAVADAREISCGPGREGRLNATWRLFAEFLEKGVIRKARVHGAFIPRQNDIELALECCRTVEQLPLPLTT